MPGDVDPVALLLPGRILLILIGAFVLTRMLRRLISRFVTGLSGEAASKRLGSLRQKTPDLLLRTGPVSTVRATRRAETVGALLRSTASFGIWTVAILMIMSELGLNLAPLVAGAGIVGIALGFGAQNLVRDFLSGIFMLIEDQYGVGDVIDAGPATGTVEGISLRTTRLRDVEGNVWHVPNGTITRVSNMSQQWNRALIDIPIGLWADAGRAQVVIKQVADEVWRDARWQHDVLAEPEVWGIESLGPDGLAIRLVVKTKPLSQWSVARELRSRIKMAFDEEGIDLTVPRRVVWEDRSSPGDGGGAGGAETIRPPGGRRRPTTRN